eukprot:SAG22_NODE_781_length_7267_cov_28.189035_1_plen_399_part_10
MPAPAQCTFVLVGGDAAQSQGGHPRTREFEHTSVSFVGEAFERLRAAGIPRGRIIVIAQLADYLGGLADGAAGRLTGWTGIPAKYYREQHERVGAQCARLLREGGADYDRAHVNPGTVWSVLLGEPAAAGGPVVPADSGAGGIVLGIYSHGDRHPAGGGGGSGSTGHHEWYAHMPYPTDRAELYDMVATAPGSGSGSGSGSNNGAAGAANNDPRRHHLYATQLRQIFHQLFARNPRRPVVGLLNYCLSGGNLDFMRRPAAVRAALGVDRWPLYLMSSSQAGTDSLVAGLWSAWFRQLEVAAAAATTTTAAAAAATGDGDGDGDATAGRSDGGGDAAASAAAMTVGGLFVAAEQDYYQRNIYELANAVKARVYCPAVRQRSSLIKAVITAFPCVSLPFLA